VPLSILYDNTKLAVAHILGDGTRQRTRVFSELQSHYLFAERFGRPGKGNDKDCFTNAAAAAFRDAHLAPGAQVCTDGAPAFHVFGEGGRKHVAIVTGGKRPDRELGAPFFNVNTLIANLSTALKAT